MKFQQVNAELNKSKQDHQKRVNDDFNKIYANLIQNDNLENYLTVNNFFGSIFDTKITNFREKTAYDRMVKDFAKFDWTDMVFPSKLR